MHLRDALGVLENYNYEGFQNIIVNIFDVILEYTPMFLPRALPQLETNIFFKVDALIRAQVSISVCATPI